MRASGEGWASVLWFVTIAGRIVYEHFGRVHTSYCANSSAISFARTQIRTDAPYHDMNHNNVVCVCVCVRALFTKTRHSRAISFAKAKVNTLASETSAPSSPPPQTPCSIPRSYRCMRVCVWCFAHAYRIVPNDGGDGVLLFSTSPHNHIRSHVQAQPKL